MSKTYLIANWKMNFTLPEAVSYAATLGSRLQPNPEMEIILAPSTPFIYPLNQAIDQEKLKLASQTLSAPDFGAFTGETSAAQLANMVQYTLLGHSERRKYFDETDDDITEKIIIAINNQITPVICVGETAAEREAGRTEEVLRTQLSAALKSIDNSDCILAYEPVWAISTQPNAKPATVEEISATVDKIIEIIPQVSTNFIPPILYGGSVTPENIIQFLEIPTIQGALIGGASLDIEKMCAMIELAMKVSK